MTDAATRFGLALALLLALSSLVVASCGYSSERVECTDHCQAEHDQCIVRAMAPEQLQLCDADTNECMNVCARY